MIEAIFERLVAANIQILPVPEIQTHFVFERDGFASLVERRPDGFGRSGAAGMLTEQGFAALVWRGTQPVFVGKGFEQMASSEQVDALRRFQNDVETALGSCPG